MLPELPQLHRQILEKAAKGYYPTNSAEKAAIVKLQGRGLLKRKVIPGTWGVGRLAVTNPLGYVRTPAGARALVGDAEPEGPTEKRHRKAGSMSRPKCRKIVMERDGYKCRIVGPRCTAQATEVHEKQTRARGGSARDPANCLASCHNCNQWAHNNGIEATAKGVLVTGRVHVLPTTDRQLGGVGASL